MSIQFNAEEIFEIAIQIERNGAIFYRNSANNTKDESTKKIFADLASMEDEHEVTFLKLKEHAKTVTWDKEFNDSNSEATMYLQAMAGGYVFNIHDDPFMNLPASTPMSDVLKAAITREKESIVFYTGMKDLVPKKLGADKIEWIIREEMKHVILLTKKLREVQG
jgi:rubrerythrin